MEPRLVLFDVDGTLIDAAGAGRYALERARREVFRVDGVDAKAAGVRFAGMTDPMILEAVARALGIAVDLYRARSADLRRSFLQALREEMGRPEPRRRVLPGVRELLEDLAARENVHLGLQTGNLEEGARTKLAAFDLNGYFPDGGFSDHPDRAELARIGWLKLSARAGIRFTPAQVTVVGDTEHDVRCARANGFRAVAVDSGWVPRQSLEDAGPDAILDDFTDRQAALCALDLAG